MSITMLSFLLGFHQVSIASRFHDNLEQFNIEKKKYEKLLIFLILTLQTVTPRISGYIIYCWPNSFI